MNNKFLYVIYKSKDFYKLPVAVLNSKADIKRWFNNVYSNNLIKSAIYYNLDLKLVTLNGRISDAYKIEQIHR